MADSQEDEAGAGGELSLPFAIYGLLGGLAVLAGPTLGGFLDALVFGGQRRSGSA
jgi:hypothetical protein